MARHYMKENTLNNWVGNLTVMGSLFYLLVFILLITTCGRDCHLLPNLCYPLLLSKIIPAFFWMVNVPSWITTLTYLSCSMVDLSLHGTVMTSWRPPKENWIIWGNIYLAFPSLPNTETPTILHNEIILKNRSHLPEWCNRKVQTPHVLYYHGAVIPALRCLSLDVFYPREK